MKGGNGTYCNTELLAKFEEYKKKLKTFDPLPHLLFSKARARLIGWLVLYGCLKPGEISRIHFLQATPERVIVQIHRGNEIVDLELRDGMELVELIIVNWINPIYKPLRRPREDIANVHTKYVTHICKRVFNSTCEQVRKACLAYYACHHSINRAVELYGSRRMAKQILYTREKQINQVLRALGAVPASELQ